LIAGACALLVSQAVIFSAWRDAWAGTVANVLLLLVVTCGWLTEGPRSFHAQVVTDLNPFGRSPIKPSRSWSQPVVLEGLCHS
jgi:hypothetical protein